MHVVKLQRVTCTCTYVICCKGCMTTVPAYVIYILTYIHTFLFVWIDVWIPILALQYHVFCTIKELHSEEPQWCWLQHWCSTLSKGFLCWESKSWSKPYNLAERALPNRGYDSELGRGRWHCVSLTCCFPKKNNNTQSWTTPEIYCMFHFPPSSLARWENAKKIAMWDWVLLKLDIL